MRPSARVTIAFFQLARRPDVLPTRRVLPRWFDVQTPATLTPNSCSTACRIAGLSASGCTSKWYSLRSWYASDDFSVTIGRTMVRCRVGIAYFPPFFFGALFFAADFFFSPVAFVFDAALAFGALVAADFFAADFRAVFFTAVPPSSPSSPASPL